jgi:hypothetical protein
MQTVAGKKPASPNARELALELVAYMRGPAPRCAAIRDREAVLVELLLDEACAAAALLLDGRAALAEQAERGELAGGARITNEPCPACKGSGRLSRHDVTYPRVARLAPFIHAGSPCACGNPSCPSGAQHAAGAELGPIDVHPSRELEAMRERDKARAERDAMHERCTELRAELEALRAGAAS